MSGNTAGSISAIINELGDSDISGMLKGKILANPAAKEGFIRALRSFLYKIKAKSKGKSLQNILTASFEFLELAYWLQYPKVDKPSFHRSLFYYRLLLHLVLLKPTLEN